MKEDIKVLEKFCDVFRMAQRSIDKSEREEYGEIIGQDEIQAIENLIARNKELEKMNEKYKIHLTDEQYLKIIDSVETDVNKEWKSKVIEIIANYFNEEDETTEEIEKFINKLLKERN